MRASAFVVLALMLLSVVAVANPLPGQPVFALQQAAGSELDLQQFTGDATLKVFYTGMGTRDTVGVRLAGWPRATRSSRPWPRRAC